MMCLKYYPFSIVLQQSLLENFVNTLRTMSKFRELISFLIHLISYSSQFNLDHFFNFLYSAAKKECHNSEYE